MKLLYSAFQMVVAFLVAIFAGPAPMLAGPKIRARTRDVAFGFRMGAGFPGDVNRSRPASIVPSLINTATQAPRAFGDPVLVAADGTSLRGLVAGDGSATPGIIYGFTVRTFPTQQMSGGPTSAIGAAAPPTSGIMDALRQGFIMCKLPAGAVVVKGGTVYAWAAATSGNNIQGALVAASSTTNTYTVTNAKFNGPADALGNVEVEVWPA